MSKQISTELNKKEPVNFNTGLTIIQEKAVIMLISGKSITETAKILEIDRGTIYNWMNKINFKAYYNTLCSNTQTRLESRLFGLHKKAIKAIDESLSSDNSKLKLQTAFWLIDKIQNKEIGQTDPREWVKNISIAEAGDWAYKKNQHTYYRLMEENNLRR